VHKRDYSVDERKIIQNQYHTVYPNAAGKSSVYDTFKMTDGF